MFVDFHILNELGTPSMLSNIFANRPAAGETGRLFVSTDTYEIYRDNGTTWDLIGGPGSSTITGTGTATEVAYFTSSQAIGSSANLFWDNTNGRLGIKTATPGASLDVHGTGTNIQLNSTGATNNVYLAFQRIGAGVWRIGDTYNAGSNYFGIYNSTLTVDALQIAAATDKTTWTAQETYTTGQARGNYLTYNLTVGAGGSFSSPNAITALGATLNLSLGGNATIPTGARSGLDAYNTVNFTSSGTLTQTQGTKIRAYSNLTTGWAFAGSATGTITHLAGLHVLFPDNSGSAVTVTNNYALLINDQTTNTGTVTYTNRWGIYQEGSSDTNYFAATTLVGTTVNSGYKFEVSGSANATTLYENGVRVATDNSVSGTTNYVPVFTGTNTIGNSVIYQSSSKIVIGSTTVTGIFDSYYTNNTVYTNGFLNKGLGIYNQSLTAGTSADIFFEVTGNGANAARGSISLIQTANGTGAFAFQTRNVAGGEASLERMRITAAGLVGIGTTSPSYNLDVQGATAQMQLKSSTGTNYALFRVNNTGGDFYLGRDNSVGGQLATGTNAYAAVINAQGAYPLQMAVNNNIAMTILNGGNILINTTTDVGYKLNVNGATYVSGQIYLTGTGFSGLGSPTVYLNNSTATTGRSYGINSFNTGGFQIFDVTSGNTTRLVIDGTGNVGISTAAPTAKLEVNGDIKTAAPNTGTAANWKLGSYKAAAVVVSTTNYIEVDIGGTLYKLAVVT